MLRWEQSSSVGTEEQLIRSRTTADDLTILIKLTGCSCLGLTAKASIGFEMQLRLNLKHKSLLTFSPKHLYGQEATSFFRIGSLLVVLNAEMLKQSSARPLQRLSLQFLQQTHWPPPGRWVYPVTQRFLFGSQFYKEKNHTSRDEIILGICFAKRKYTCWLLWDEKYVWQLNLHMELLRTM